jgi:plastocyanin
MMTIRARTSFLVLLVVAAGATVRWPVLASRTSAPAGSIAGTLTTREPATPPLRVTIDPAICGTSVPDESVAVDPAGGLANVVITVAGVKAQAPAEVALRNEKCRFVPHVGLVRPGGIVKVTNADPPPVLHTTHAQMSGGKFLFNVSLPLPNQTIAKPVDKTGTLQLACNTHPWMQGWLIVTDELSAVSGPDGRFRIGNVPPGTYELRFWHEVLKSAPVRVTVKDGETLAIDRVFTRPTG